MRFVTGRTRSWSLVGAIATALFSLAANPEPSTIAISMGDTRLSLAELQARISTAPHDALGGQGKISTAQRFAEQFLVPELLLTEAARRQGLEKAPAFAPKRKEVLRRLLEAELKKEVAAEITPGAVRAYYDAHRADFESPEAILIWRILLDDPALARQLIADSKGAGGPARWRAFAREHSLDAATKLRGGMLGFVRADGSTDVPQLEVDSALYAAANVLRDGELAAEPVKEGARLAVVWRRGTRAEVKVPFVQASERIKAVLARQQGNDKLQALLVSLRSQYLTDYNPERIEAITYPAPALRSGDSFPPTAAGSAMPLVSPQKGERGLR